MTLAAVVGVLGGLVVWPLGTAEASMSPPAPSISADGRYVAFASRSDDLSPADDDSVVNAGVGGVDIFVRDLQTNTITLVSRASGASGAAADTWSVSPSISADGRHVAFHSPANNLSDEDDDSIGNVYLRDLQTDTTTFVSRASGAAGVAGNSNSDDPSVSADGRFVAFASFAWNLSPEDAFRWGGTDIFVRDLQNNTTTVASRAGGASGALGDGWSEKPSISADGRYVVFASEADNLSSEDDDSVIDIFVRDLETNTTTLVSRASGVAGAPANRSMEAPYSDAPSISADGRFVAFSSTADNLSAEDVDFVRVVCISGKYGYCYDLRVGDIFVRDLQTNTTTLVSRASGASGAPADDGGASAFDGVLAREPAMSADGRYVAFSSAADNLSAEDDDEVRDIYVRDLQTNTTTLVSRASGATGEPFADESTQPSISADGRFVAFGSRRCREGETKGTDVYVRDLQAKTTTWVGQDPNPGVCPTADPLPSTGSLPSNDFRFGKLKRNLKKGTAKLTVKVPGPGELVLKKSKRVRKDSDQARGAGKVRLRVRPRQKARAKLADRGKLKVSAQVTYTPTGGEPNTESKKVKLKRR
jgi:Tol biopolymer transport system component